MTQHAQHTQSSQPPQHETSGATFEQQTNQQRHPYFITTITPAGGLIVNMHWLDQPMEPMAFTNDADFSAWLKGAMNQLATGRLPPGIRPQRIPPKRPMPAMTHGGTADDEIEYEPFQATPQPKGLGARLGGLLGGGRN